MSQGQSSGREQRAQGLLSQRLYCPLGMGGAPVSWTVSRFLASDTHERCIPADANQKLPGNLQLFPRRPQTGTSTPTQYPAVCMALTLPEPEERGVTEEEAPSPVQAASRVSPRATPIQKLPQYLV